ncbi:MAG: class I SAM-dependent methyltransferase [Anaerolineae bacterium]|nr:class I SAM-dependent methyltransferase [Anaerolineae bacterium]
MSVEESRLFYETVARYYDAENAHKTEDLAFYSDMAADADGPILDVGSGTGRVVLHLAQEGYTVHGIEPSAAMLERAAAKLDVLPDLRPQVTMTLNDIMDYTPPVDFDLITVSYHAFMHLRTQAEQMAALERFRAWLAPEGRLVIDLPNAGYLFATPDDGSLVLERTFVEPESGHLVMQQSVSDLDRAEQLMHITWIYDEMDDDGTVRRLLAPLTMHYYFPAEMDLLLRVAGLAREAFYGDYEFGPFEDGCPRMIVVAGREG